MKTLRATRFGMFAVAHILWSILCSPFVPRLLNGEVIHAGVVAAVMILLYVAWGWVVAHFCRWSAPTRKQSLWAVFLPTGIAWLWAGTTALCLFLEGDYIMVAAMLGVPAFLLASPSLLFVIFFVAVMGRLFHLVAPLGGDLGVTGAAIFLAGLLPPLLFWAGSCLGAVKKEADEKGPEAA